MRRPSERFVASAVFGGLLVLWQIGSGAGWFNPLLLPAPSKILTTLVIGLFAPSKSSYAFVFQLVHSLSLLVSGFAIGAVLGIFIGVAAGVSSPVYRLVSPILGFITPIPAIAWTPVA